MPRPKVGGRIRGVSIAAALIQFTLAGVGIFAVVALVAGSRVRDSGTSEAIRDAREWASLIADDIVGPRVTSRLLAGDEKAISELDEDVATVVNDAPIGGIKVWTYDGRVVYSDQKQLIGTRFDLEEPVLEAVRSGQPFVDFTDSKDVEADHAFSDGRWLEVYYPFTATDGTKLIYEHYQHTNALSAGASQVTAAFSPLVLKSLIALELLQIPLAWWLARRVREAQRQKTALVQSALDASELERRRIAQDLHDGVVQDLAGVSYSLDFVRHDPVVRESPGALSTLDRVVEEAQKSLKSLRTLIVDIYPPSLDDGDLAGALGDLLTPLAAHGMATTFTDDTTGTMSTVAQTLIYRTARESLRNVQEHASASSVTVRIADQGEARLVLEVVDDGCGFTAAQLAARQKEGHLGVRLLADVAKAAGGELRIDSEVGKGTKVHLEVPR